MFTENSPVNYDLVKVLELNHDKKISVIVNVTIFFVLIFISAFLLIWYRKKSKGLNLIFIFYLLFWIPIFLGRDFRTQMNNAIDNSNGVTPLDNSIITMVMIGYGLVGIFARIFADYINFLFKYRKVFLYIAIIINIVCFIPIIVNQTGVTNIIQVIGVGISASCIGTVELLFKQKANNKAFLSVSLLSIPPLLANFLTAPIQSIFTELSTSISPATNKPILDRPDVLKYMWVIGLIVLFVCLILVLFIKERKHIHDHWDVKNVYQFKQKNTKNQVIYFVLIALIGAIIMFVKFSNSGANGVNHLSVLAKYNNTTSAAYQGYLSLIFSLAQLAAGVLMGTILVKKMRISNIFLIGSGIWIAYLILAIFIKNPIAFFVIHAMNGFAYGILYNLLLALVLAISLNTSKITSMGIYQSILSIGITCSGWFTAWLKIIIPQANKSPNNPDDLSKYFNQYFESSSIVDGVLIASIVLITIIFMFLCFYLKKRDIEFYKNNLDKTQIKIKK